MDRDNGQDFVGMLRRQKPNVPVFIIAKTGDCCEEAEIAGADGYFILPDDEQQLLDAIRRAKNPKKSL